MRNMLAAHMPNKLFYTYLESVQSVKFQEKIHNSILSVKFQEKIHFLFFSDFFIPNKNSTICAVLHSHRGNLMSISR